MAQELRKVPYVTSKGDKKHAIITPLSFSHEGLSQKHLRVLAVLSQATNHINKIFVQQQHPQGLELYKILRKLEDEEQDAQKKELLKNFNLIFCARNGLYNHTDGLTQQFPLSIPESLKPYEELLLRKEAPKGRGFYPEDFSEEEAEGFYPELKNKLNSLVCRNEQGLAEVKVNEEFYEKELRPIITLFSELEELLEDDDELQELLVYVRAKKKELMSGSQEDRFLANKAWLGNRTRIDFVYSTAIETYVDRIFGVRGEAEASAFVINQEYQGFTERFSKLLPSLEERAPWTHKKIIHQDNIPQLRFVDVVVWGGGCEVFPGMYLAQSLPNEQRFREEHGSVNLVFANIQETITASLKNELSRFIPQEEWRTYNKNMSHITLLMTAVHEVGHASGGVAIKEDPGELFGNEYHIMEEARAELFSLWALPILVEEKEISVEEEMTGYYSMLLTMINSLKEAPIDHSGSRNIMLHYFLEQGAVVEETKDGLPVFQVNKEKMREATKELLKTIGDIRATGDKQALKELRDKYMRTERRQEFEEYLKDLPQGRLLVFPEIKEEDGKLIVKPVKDFRKQDRVLDAYI